MITRRRTLGGMAAGLGAAQWTGLTCANAALGDAAAERIVARYPPPSAALVDHRGAPVELAAELAQEGPVLMNFIFTTCAGVCPMLTALFAATADALGPDLAQTRLWSVSIDPDQDTPEQLARYAAAFAAPQQWRFLTGAPSSVHAVRDAFDALDDIKMAHRPVTLLRLRRHLWARFEGDVAPETLTRETRAVLIGA